MSFTMRISYSSQSSNKAAKDSKGGATIHLSVDELEKLNKAPETDEDF